MLNRRGGIDRLSGISVALFAISTLFPIVASIYPHDAPRWLGVADVSCAALLLTTAIAVTVQLQNRVGDQDRLDAFRMSRSIITAIPVLLVGFFVAGSRIKWDVLVIGLAWRAWLLLYSLPYLIAARRLRSSD